MKYAIIRLNDRQYKVSEGDEFLVDGFIKESPEFEVLMLVDGEKVEVGQPVLSKAKLKVKVVSEEKGEKIYVSKYKAKSRYRKRTGFRSQNTRLLVEKIG